MFKSFQTYVNIFVFLGTLTDGEFSEKDWPADVDSLDPYPKSKTLAEKAAWDFIKELKGRPEERAISGVQFMSPYQVSLI